MAHTQPAQFNPKTFLAKVGNGKTTLNHETFGVLFSQGDAANAGFYIQKGRVKLTAVSAQGMIGILEQGAFFGEGCLAGQLVCVATATALDASTVVRIDKAAMMRVLHQEPTFAALFMAYLLSHSIRIQEDLVDHLFNSAEKRLARILLLMAHFGKEDQPALVIPKISQEMLASMVGTTRSRVSFFMRRFKQARLHKVQCRSPRA